LQAQQQQAPAAPTRPFHNYTDEMLVERREEHEVRIANDKLVIAAIDAEIRARHGHAVQVAYDERDKSHGELTLAGPVDGLQLKAKIDKTVKWDSAKLQNLATLLMLPVDKGGLGWTFDKVRAFFKIEFSVPEKNMLVADAAFAEAHLKALTDARTVTFKPLAVQLVRKGD
jgi:hypothetical protein